MDCIQRVIIVNENLFLKVSELIKSRIYYHIVSILYYSTNRPTVRRAYNFYSHDKEQVSDTADLYRYHVFYSRIHPRD